MRNINNKEQTLLFADDSEYLIFKKLNNSTPEKAQKYVSELESWCKLWRSTLAPKKCNYRYISNVDGNGISKCIRFADVTITVVQR
jgi:hypothetical protein